MRAAFIFGQRVDFIDDHPARRLQQIEPFRLAEQHTFGDGVVFLRYLVDTP